jgi:plastocyanin
MKRREFVEKAGFGAAALAALGTAGPADAATTDSTQHNHGPISGPLASATVSFGAWLPGSRFPNIGAVPGLPVNLHALIPNEVTIKAGGTVNFIVAGFHLIAVYGDGTSPADINTSITMSPTTQPMPPLINDSNNRVYLGIDPTVMPQLAGPPQGPAQPRLQDRVEVVHFPDPGRYLVICAVLPHFLDNMFGYVKVNP